MNIQLSVNPEFELRLVSVSIEQDSGLRNIPASRVEIGHAWFSIFSEAGEITTGALLVVERRGDVDAHVAWRLEVLPRPALEMLADAMGKLILTKAGEEINRLCAALVST